MSRKKDSSAAEALPPEAPTPRTGKMLAAAKKKGEGKPASPSEQKARLEIAKAKKGRKLAPVKTAEPLMTAQRAFVARSNKAIVSAFLHTEKLRGKVRKLSRKAWAVELDKFTKAPR